MAFRKPASKRVGLKVLSYGKAGSGKTLFSLSFPKILAIDSENGMTFYEGTEDGKNLLGIDNTQSYQDLEDALYEIEDNVEDFGAETFVLDSESKVYQNIQETIMIVEEKRARAKGRDVLDTNLSVRSWGKIGQIAKKLQNMKIDLTSQGVNFVSVAQASEIKEKQGDSFVVVGHKPDMDKKAEFDYDIVLYHYTEKQADGNTKYFARVEKDRTKTFKTNDVIENPKYNLWGSRIDSLKDKDTLNTSYTEKMKESQAGYEEDIEEEERTLVERLGKLMSESEASVKTKILADMASAKITSLDGLTTAQSEKLEKIYSKYKR